MADAPGVKIDIEATNALLLKVRSKINNLEPVLDGPIANRVHELFEKVFATEGRYAGEPWAPLKPRTLKAKARIHRAHMGILRRFNTLWASLVKRGSPFGFRIATPASLRMGSVVPYAAVHQHGSRDGRIPQRRMIPETVPAKDQEAWAQLIADYAVEG